MANDLDSGAVRSHNSTSDCRRSGLTVLFVGSSLVFSDWMLKVSAAEAGGVETARLDDLDAAEAELQRNPGLRLVVVEEAHADQLARALETFRHHHGSVLWALAYRDVAVARRIVEQWLRGGPLQEVQLLPMNVPVAIWASMFRLTLSGDFFVPRNVLPPVPDVQADPGAVPDGRIGGLTRREIEVLDLVAQGGQNKVIAHRLGLSEHTVKLHIHRIITKVGVRNRTAAARWYLSACEQD